jgi:hypothetical protein
MKLAVAKCHKYSCQRKRETASLFFPFDFLEGCQHLNSTTIKSRSVCREGTMLATGIKKIDATNKMAVTTHVSRCVRRADTARSQTYVGCMDVPKIAPIEVAIESANNALSIFD